MSINTITYSHPDFIRQIRIHQPFAQGPLTHTDGEFVLNRIAEAFAPTFEEPNGSLPPGTIEAHFQPADEAKQIEQIQRMRKAIKDGSRYLTGSVVTVAAPASRTERPTALMQPHAGLLVKLSPSRPDVVHKWHLLPPNCFLNDIMVTPRIQQRHIATLGLHAALKYGGFQRHVSVHTNALQVVRPDGSEPSWQVSRWLESLGLEPQPDVQVAPLIIGGYQIPQIRYASPKGHNVGTMIDKLEARHSWLKKVVLA